MRSRRSALAWVAACLLAVAIGAQGQMSGTNAQTILRELQSFRQMGSVLYIAAHPDDENNELIGYLARGRDYRTGYLSVTRGDGGQNVLGPEFGEKLGVARTQELLAARGVDGGRQFFTRAIDFGFSKSYAETLNIWDKQGVLSDMVRVIRTFRPDILITRFSPIPGGTHGHHTASAILATNAFRLAGDPNAFPEQLTTLKPWQPVRILWNGSGFERNKTSSTNQVIIDAGGKDPVTGETFNDIAGLSRSMHKTQGFGRFRPSGRGSEHEEHFQLLDGAPVTNDIMDGVDTSWNRVAGGAEIGAMAGGIVREFNTNNPSASVSALLLIRQKVAALGTNDPIVAEKAALLDRILQNCLGLEFGTTIAPSAAVPGEQITLRHSALTRSDVSVSWIRVLYPATGKDLRPDIPLHLAPASQIESAQTLPLNTPLTDPYWLREEGTPGMFRVDDASLIGRPENPPAFPIEFVFSVGGQTLVLPDTSARPDVIPPVWLRFASDIALLNPGASRAVKVEVIAARGGVEGTLSLDAPAGWKISPESQRFHLAGVGGRTMFDFSITAPAEAATAKIVADAEVGGVHWRNQREEISYPHIPRQLLQPLASLKALSLDLATRGHNIGYLPGAGDSVAEDLRQMGYAVTVLDDDDLTPEQLKAFDAAVIGVRAFNVRTNLAPHIAGLFAYVENGGTVVAQYNRPDNLKTPKVAPYDLHLSGERVTDETAEVTFLAPDNPVLNTPNKITQADFAGWIQERGIYFPNEWDDHFTPILACHDPGEAPLKGSLLVASYGKGYFVYTGLVFFRELPAGVPGAYRLFANLVSLGK